MRPLRLVLSLSSCLLAILLLSYLAASRTQLNQNADERSGLSAYFNWHSPSSLFPPSAIISLTDENSTFFLARPANFGPPLPSKGLSGPLWIGSGFGDDHLGRGGVAGAEGELGCSDVPGWNEGDYGSTTGGISEASSKSKSTKASTAGAKGGETKSSKDKRSLDDLDESEEDTGVPAEDDGTDDHLHHPLPASDALKTGAETAEPGKKQAHADIQSLQESAEIAGKVVLLSRGGCGFLEKVKWVQRRGGRALIVGDDIRGGPLVTMYARGDTSNVTIPSVFTSHMTAHLLSSLVPSGGSIDDIPVEEATRLGLVAGEGTSKGSTSRKGKTQKASTGSGSKSTMSKKKASVAKSSQDESKGSSSAAKSDKASGHKRSWLRSLFSSSGRNGHEDSTRFPSSGNIDWVLQADFNEDEVPKPKTRTAGSAKKASQTKGAGKSSGDGFVIGVQDWRDPDLVDTTGESGNEAAKSSAATSASASKGAVHGQPNGGSITPGSGEYVASHKASSKSSSKDSSNHRSNSQGKGEDGSWMDKLSWTDEDNAASDSSTKSHSKPARPAQSAKHEVADLQTSESDDNIPDTREGLWVTLTPTSMSSSPFFDTLLVLVVSPLVTLTVVYALLLLRSRIRRRRWRAPKSVVERLPVRTYHTITSTNSSTTTSSATSSPLTRPATPTSTTPLLHSGARPISQGPGRMRPRSRTAGELPASGTSFQSSGPLGGGTPRTPGGGIDHAQEKRESGLAEWRRRYGGKQKECVVCLEEYVDGVSRVMSLPCGHEFHAECM